MLLMALTPDQLERTLLGAASLPLFFLSVVVLSSNGAIPVHQHTLYSNRCCIWEDKQWICILLGANTCFLTLILVVDGD